MRPEQKQVIEVPYLAQGQIEAAAQKLICDYGNKFSPIKEPPILLDEIAECLLDLDLSFDDPLKVFGDSSVLGCLDVSAKRIVISAQLSPETNLGRYRFTLGHEIGHWCLHAPILAARESQLALGISRPQNNILCRGGDAKRPPIEWQADTFSANLLMPREMVIQQWRRDVGMEPIWADSGVDFRAQWSLGQREDSTLEIARILASSFEVSAFAMQIRLVDLNLLRRSTRQGDLFRK